MRASIPVAGLTNESVVTAEDIDVTTANGAVVGKVLRAWVEGTGILGLEVEVADDFAESVEVSTDRLSIADWDTE